MKRVAAFFHWLGTPIRATRTLFPFTHEGRQTLIYLIFAGSGPILTLVGLRILNQTEAASQWGIYASQARIFGWSLFVIVSGLGMFVSIRAFKIGKDGFEFSSKEEAIEAARKVAEGVKTEADNQVAEVASGDIKP